MPNFAIVSGLLGALLGYRLPGTGQSSSTCETMVASPTCLRHALSPGARPSRVARLRAQTSAAFPSPCSVKQVAVRGARVTLQPPSPARALRCETEISGLRAPQIPSGAPDYVEKGLLCRELVSRTLWLLEVEITLNHLKEIKGNGRRPRIAAHDRARKPSRRSGSPASMS